MSSALWAHGVKVSNSIGRLCNKKRLRKIWPKFSK